MEKNMDNGPLVGACGLFRALKAQVSLMIQSQGHLAASY